MNLRELTDDSLFPHLFSFTATGEFVDLTESPLMPGMYLLRSDHPGLREINHRILSPGVIAASVASLGFTRWEPWTDGPRVSLALRLLALTINRWMDRTARDDPSRERMNTLRIVVNTLTMHLSDDETALALSSALPEAVRPTHGSVLFAWLRHVPDAAHNLLQGTTIRTPYLAIRLSMLQSYGREAVHILYDTVDLPPKLEPYCAEVLEDLGWNLQDAPSQKTPDLEKARPGPQEPDSQRAAAREYGARVNPPETIQLRRPLDGASLDS